MSVNIPHSHRVGGRRWLKAAEEELVALPAVLEMTGLTELDVQTLCSHGLFPASVGYEFTNWQHWKKAQVEYWIDTLPVRRNAGLCNFIED